MVTSKHRRVQMLVANKHMLLLSLLVCMAVSSQESLPSKFYELQSFTSSSGYTYLNLKSFHREMDELVPAAYYVNNLIINKDSKPGNTVISVLPGSFDITARSVSKEDIFIENIVLQKGDSISIKFYLRDDPEPLHD